MESLIDSVRHMDVVFMKTGSFWFLANHVMVVNMHRIMSLSYGAIRSIAPFISEINHYVLSLYGIKPVRQDTVSCSVVVVTLVHGFRKVLAKGMNGQDLIDAKMIRVLKEFIVCDHSVLRIEVFYVPSSAGRS